MTDVLISAADDTAVSLRLVRTDDLAGWLERLPEQARRWATSAGFKAKPGQFVWLPGDSGAPGWVAVGWDGRDSLDTLGGLPLTLAEGAYRVDDPVSELQLLGWALGSYQFDRYKAAPRKPAQLVLPDGAKAERLGHFEEAIRLVRDLINTPAADMLPSHLAAEAEQLAEQHGATCTIAVGDELLDRNLFAIHAVGRAADDAPRLIDIRWGDEAHPLVVLVGKGVCFDSGGLDIKPAANMRTMKKDMGGAAQVLGLAHLIMSERLPLRLRVLVPAVENAISGNAFRPGDVLATYKGLTVEIDNTDAEGRLILCDALALAAEEQPALMLDFATLTGAARTAVGAEISAMFSNADDHAAAIQAAGDALDDPIWRLPLHKGYGYMLESKVADLANSTGSPYAGAVTAALYLERFVGTTPWVHFDIMAFNTRARPGRPEGGEAMAMRAVFRHLEERFAAS
jgi:leucyl aminopeptidase